MLGNNRKLIFTIIGLIILPAVWFFLKTYLNIADRYLPSIESVLIAFKDIEPSIWIHALATFTRLIVGFTCGILTGLILGLSIYSSPVLFSLLMPSVQALRSIPAVATIPFFLLWFGFSDTGRYVMIIAGISLNVSIAAYQILSNTAEKYTIMFQSFGVKPQQFTFSYSLPLVLEKILPTMRFSLSTAIGIVIVSEFLGSQVGLGYVIQTSRSTFSMHVIFLSTIFLGIINFVTDKMLVELWNKIVFWRV